MDKHCLSCTCDVPKIPNFEIQRFLDETKWMLSEKRISKKGLEFRRDELQDMSLDKSLPVDQVNAIRKFLLETENGFETVKL